MADHIDKDGLANRKELEKSDEGADWADNLPELPAIPSGEGKVVIVIPDRGVSSDEVEEDDENEES